MGITHGDINGVGYEVILKALADERITELCTPVIFGSQKIANKCRKDLDIEDFVFRQVKNLDDISDGDINLFDIGCDDVQLTPGVPSPQSGRAAVKALEAACAALENGDIDVLVTAPICKQTANSVEFDFPGHTEYLQHRIGNGARSLMILFDDNIRVALVSTHLPISEVASAVTREAVQAAVEAMNASLKLDFSIFRPKIAVLGLNPHCGDSGLLGGEEISVIRPAVEACCEKGVLAFGPFAADGFFASGAFRKYDGVVAMYHDQGLAPFKALAGEAGVNFTAGLPFVRTSPDHGTAFDIAWRGQADPTSMREAIYRAIDIYRSRLFQQEAAENPLKEVPSERCDRSERPDRGDIPPKKERQDPPAAQSRRNDDLQLLPAASSVITSETPAATDAETEGAAE